MSRRYLFLIGLVIVVGVFLLFNKKAEPPLTVPEKPRGIETASKKKISESQPPAKLQKTALDILREAARNEVEKNILANPDPSYARYYLEQKRIDPNFDWKHPISFWGKAVDENEQPIAGASVHFTWSDASERGTSESDATSDSNGLFSLLNRTGKGVSIKVSKEGYYDSADSRKSFEYASPFEGRFIPDANKPVVFHLRKKGQGVDLITSQYGVRDSFGVTAPLDGMPMQVDLLERKTGKGQLTIKQIKPESKKWKQAVEWSFRVEIPEGGFVEHNEEFPFEAPEDNYQPVVDFKFQKDQTDWAQNLKKDYYIKFGSPPRYGRLHLETSIMTSGVRLTYAINPTGSRNLEYNPEARPKQTVFE